MSTLKTNTIDSLNGTDEVSIPTLDQRMAKAWVNFNGTGVVAIRGSYNVSSITDNGSGTYTVNLSQALPTLQSSSMNISTNALSSNQACSMAPISTSSIDIAVFAGGVSTDFDIVCLSVFSV